MGGGDTTPSTSTPGEHADRYSTDASNAGALSGAGEVKVVTDGGVRFARSQYNDELRDPVIQSEEIEHVLDQETVQGPLGTEVHGIDSSWANNRQAEAGALKSVQLAENADTLDALTQNGVIDGESLDQLRDRGVSEFSTNGSEPRLRMMAQSHGVEETQKLLHTLHANQGENIHDIGGDAFSTGEREMLANLEMTRNGASIRDFRNNGGYAGAGVGYDTDSLEELQQKLESNGSVLVGVQNNESLTAFNESLRERAANGELTVDADPDEIMEGLREMHTTEYVVGFDSVEELQSFYSGETRSQYEFEPSGYTSPGEFSREQQLSSTETQAVAETLVHEHGVSADEFETRFKETLGYDVEDGNPHQHQVDVPAQKTVVKRVDVSDPSDTHTLYFDPGSDEAVQGASDHAGEFDYAYNEMDMVVVAEQDGEVMDVTCQNITEYDFDQKSSQHYASFDSENVVEKAQGDGSALNKVKILGSPEDYRTLSSDAVEYQGSNDELHRPDGASDVRTAADLNQSPDPGSVYDLRDLSVAAHNAFLDRETDVVFTGGRKGGEQKGKQIGDDGEEMLIPELYPEYSDEVGAHETNQFPDFPRSLAEGKLYRREGYDSGDGINLGVRNPGSTGGVDAGVSDGDSGGAGVNPADVRYVMAMYEPSSTGISDLTGGDLQTVVESQPATGWDDVLRDGVSQSDVVSGDVSVSDGVREDITDADFQEITGVAIASGRALENSDETSVSEKPVFKLNRESVVSEDVS